MRDYRVPVPRWTGSLTGMHILHIYKDYYPTLGGIENSLRSLAEGLVERGYEVSVLVVNTRPRTEEDSLKGVRVIRAARLGEFASTPLSIQLFSRVRRLRPDLIHLHFPFPPGEVAHLFFGTGRLVLTYHSDIIRQKILLRLYVPLLRRVLHRADRIIATSPQTLMNSPFLQPVAQKCLVVPFGLDTASLRTVDSTRVHRVREDYGSPLLLFVGRLRYYKGLEYLLEAMRYIPARLLVIGDGPKRRVWERLAQKLRLRDKVSFLGEVETSSLAIYYNACDVFVLPSSHRSEAFGLVQLEAMAAGKPVVSTELGTGTSMVNQNGVTGFVVQSRNPDSLQQAICQLLEHSELRRTMGRAAQERVERFFNREEMLSQVCRIYNDLF